MDDQRTDRESGIKLLLAIISLTVAGIAMYCFSHTDPNPNKVALRSVFLVATMIAGAVAWWLFRGVKPNKK